MKTKYLIKATNPNSNLIQLVFCADQIKRAQVFAEQEKRFGDSIPSGEIVTEDGTIIERCNVVLEEEK